MQGFFVNEMTDPNIQVRLASERTEMALERTQLAWIRTTFAIIGAGLALDKGLQAMAAADIPIDADWKQSGHVAALSLCFVATISLLWATIRFSRYAKQMSQSTYNASSLSPALLLSGIVILLGTAVVLGLVLWG